MSKVKDEVGNRYGRLLVVERSPNKGKKACWRCKCICGNMITASGDDLRRGDTRSCGCLRREKSAERMAKLGRASKGKQHGLKHGFAVRGDVHPLYRVFKNMKQRCHNPNAHNFKHYGARGIAVCAAWLNDAEAFVTWALANGWKQGMQIHRINNDGDYSSDNCIFLSAGEHAKLHRGTK